MLIPDTALQHKPQHKTLSQSDAVDIWIARWLRIRRVDILRRYGCDPRRIYEIWEGKRHPASRDLALKTFNERYPTLSDRVDFGNHRTISRSNTSPDQLQMFPETNPTP